MTALLLNLYSYIFLQVGDLIEGIFKAGFWAAIIIVVLIMVGGFWLYRKFTHRNKHKSPDSDATNIRS